MAAMRGDSGIRRPVDRRHPQHNRRIGHRFLIGDKAGIRLSRPPHAIRCMRASRPASIRAASLSATTTT